MKSLWDWLVLAGIYRFCCYPKWKKLGRRDFWLRNLACLYFCFVLYFTLMPILAVLPEIGRHSYKTMNLIPFIDVIESHGDYLRQLVLNILLMVPFGILVPLIHPKKSLWETVRLTFFLSLAIELLQPLLHGSRASDITDLITNVLGGLLGYGLYWLFRRLRQARHTGSAE